MERAWASRLKRTQGIDHFLVDPAALLGLSSDRTGSHDLDLTAIDLGPESLEEIHLDAFELVVGALRESYAPGETAEMTVTATRRPSARWPVADLSIVMGLSIGPAFMSATGRTNEDGEATLKIRLNPDVPQRPVVCDAYGLKMSLEGQHAVIYEYGFSRRHHLFHLTA